MRECGCVGKKVCVDVCVCASKSDTAKGRVIVSESVQMREKGARAGESERVNE